ncbi:DUF2442 domain-containing protein [bacterium]|nr:DUF2442 domain-containing protein [bacterium]
MRSSQLGANTSRAEVTHIDSHGLWLFVAEREYFLPYGEYPWFREARIGEILDVELLHETHVHWPALDVDLCLESLENPEQFPLISRK